MKIFFVIFAAIIGLSTTAHASLVNCVIAPKFQDGTPLLVLWTGQARYMTNRVELFTTLEECERQATLIVNSPVMIFDPDTRIAYQIGSAKMNFRLNDTQYKKIFYRK